MQLMGTAERSLCSEGRFRDQREILVICTHLMGRRKTFQSREEKLDKFIATVRHLLHLKILSQENLGLARDPLQLLKVIVHIDKVRDTKMMMNTVRNSIYYLLGGNA